MATDGTPNEGRDEISNRVYTTGTIKLTLYVNLVDSLSNTTVYADLTQPTGTGYAEITLNGVFSETDGVVTYDHGTPDDPEFENTESEGGSNWSTDITGVAMVTTTDIILHFQDLTSSVTMTPGKKLKIDVSTLIAP